MRRTITTWGLAALFILGLSISVDAAGYDDYCKEKPWKCNTTTTQPETTTAPTTTTPSTTSSSTTSTPTTTSTSLPDSTTSTTLATTTTTQPPETTTAPVPTTIAQPVEWSWHVECGILFVDFPAEIVAVDLYYYNTVIYTFTEPGYYIPHPEAANDPLQLVPVPDGNHFPVPDSAQVMVGDCSVVPPPTDPSVPETPDPTAPVETLPFTGPEDNLGPIAASLSTLGLIALIGARTLRRDEDDA